MFKHKDFSIELKKQVVSIRMHGCVYVCVSVSINYTQAIQKLACEVHVNKMLKSVSATRTHTFR